MQCDTVYLHLYEYALLNNAWIFYEDELDDLIYLPIHSMIEKVNLNKPITSIKLKFNPG